MPQPIYIYIYMYACYPLPMRCWTLAERIAPWPCRGAFACYKSHPPQQELRGFSRDQARNSMERLHVSIPRPGGCVSHDVSSIGGKKAG